MRAILSSDGSIQLGGFVFKADIGAAGVVAQKSEGDHGTPADLLPLRQLFYRPDREKPPRCAVPTKAMTPTDGWCDAPNDPAYNRQIVLPYPASHEALWRADHIYDIVGVLGWNDDPPRPGLGSAIFLHLATPSRTPTEGCIALPKENLLTLLAAGLTEILVLSARQNRRY